MLLVLSGAWIYRHLEGITGVLSSWHTSLHIVVFESDDWGNPGLSRSSLKTLAASLGFEDFLLPLTYERNLNWWRYTLESLDDLEALYTVLERHFDSRGRHPVFTANMIVTRPDYDAIQASNFQKYVYTEPSKDLVAKWREGYERGVFFPQLHGREHFDYRWWLRDLRSGDNFIRKAFDLRILPVPSFVAGNRRIYYGPYLDLSSLPSRSIPYEEQKEIIEDAMRVFEKLFGYKSISTIAPCYMWDDNTEKAWYSVGIRYIQSGNYQIVGRDKKGKFMIVSHKLGEKNKLGQVYLVRNCRFKQRLMGNKGWRDTLRQIEQAFSRGYPAIINTHSINYVSGIDPRIPKIALANLDSLLWRVESEYPDVIYLTSVELGELIEYGLFHDVITGKRIVLSSHLLGSYKWILGNTKVILILSFITIISIIYWRVIRLHIIRKME